MQSQYRKMPNGNYSFRNITQLEYSIVHPSLHQVLECYERKRLNNHVFYKLCGKHKKKQKNKNLKRIKHLVE